MALQAFLDTYQIAGGDYNVSSFGGKQKYLIPSGVYESFLELVAAATEPCCGLIERAQACMPLVLDLDFLYSRTAFDTIQARVDRFAVAAVTALARVEPEGDLQAFANTYFAHEPFPLLDDNVARKFTQIHCRRFITEFVVALYKVCNMRDFTRPLRFFVLLKARPLAVNGGAGVKDGIHILCPDIRIPQDLKKRIYHELATANVIDNVFDGTGFINPGADVLDDGIDRSGLFLYGSGKPGQGAGYVLNHIWLVETNVINHASATPLNVNYAFRAGTIDDLDLVGLTKTLSINYRTDAALLDATL
jgi:hypothetical protein